MNFVSFGKQSRWLTARNIAWFLVGSAGLLQFFWLPMRDLPLQSDELGYLTDGLLVAEGILPGYSFAPAAWPALPAALYAFANFAWNFLGTIGESNFAINALSALDAALFQSYADMSRLRLTIGVGGVLLALAATWAGAIYGYRLAGITGAALCGGLNAILPLFVEFAAQPRPYSAAWSLISLAALAALSAQPWWRSWGAGMLLGFAVACRIDAVVALPLLPLLQAWQSNNESILHRLIKTLAGLITAFLVAAPWYALTLLGNLRTLVTVRLLNTGGGDTSVFESLVLNALLLPIILVVLGAILGRPRRWWLYCTLYLVPLAILLLKPSPFGLRHQGSIVVVLVLLTPIALSALRARTNGTSFRMASVVFVLLTLGHAAVETIVRTIAQSNARRPETVTAWIEANAPAGVAVFMPPLLRQPLPTPQSAERLWSEVAAPNAWQRKLQQSGAKYGLPDNALPRALSDRHAAQDRGNRRRIFILAGNPAISRPRYDLHLVSSGSIFDVTPAEAVRQFCRSGGVLIIEGTAPPELGAPSASWTATRPEHSLQVFQRGPGTCRN